MSDEKIEPKGPVEAEQKVAKAETQAAPAQAAPPKEAPKAPVKEAAKKEKPSNCAGCNKSIKKKRWYYRNGKSYCTKRCWQSASKKEKPAPPQGAS